MRSRLFLLIALSVICGHFAFCGAAQQSEPVPGLSAWESDEQESGHLQRDLMAVPEFRDYLTNYSAPMLAKRVDWKDCPAEFYILARFKLHENGTVSSIELFGCTNSPAARVVVKAIRGRPRFSKWPKGMRGAVGRSYIEMFTRYGSVTMPGCANKPHAADPRESLHSMPEPLARAADRHR
jgi:hypothetical protein